MITNWDQISKEAAAADRRKEKRVHLAFSIAISAFNRNGDPMAERTKTLDISEYGCRIATRLPLERGDVIGIALVVPNEKGAGQDKPVRFEVMWTTEDSNARVIGARQMEGDSLWNVYFPTFKSSLNSSNK